MPLHRLLNFVVVVAVAAVVVYLGSFKVLDRDFWWHIKAGEIMVESRELIKTEPFAYTRAGQPYKASQSWLAEVALYGIHRAGGINGVIIFRTLVMLATFGVLLALDPKRLWPHSLLALYAAVVVQSSFLERPQLFTYLGFAVTLWLAWRIAEKGLTRGRATALIITYLLWVNLHGAASIVGLLTVAALAAQKLFEWYVRPRPAAWTSFQQVALLGGALLVATLLSPSHYHNLTYLWTLLNDRTIVFISEWRPRPWGAYLSDYALLWAFAIGSLVLTRRRWVLSALLLAFTGYMSRTALRHEILFVIAALAVTFYQLRWNERYLRAMTWLVSRPVRAVLATGLVFAFLVCFAAARFRAYAAHDHLWGYGAFDLARGANDFLERSGVQGRLFNTYGIGGYLIYRGYPDRPVFIDGRNVDYGFAFMSQAYQAGFDSVQWAKLEQQYDLTYAVIDYDAIAEPRGLPYINHLGQNDQWALVYLDDWVAVYLKNIPANAALIDQYQYHVLTPEYLHFSETTELAGLPAVLAGDSPAASADLEAELERAASSNPEGIKARLRLSHRHIKAGQFDSARELVDAAARTQPYRAAVHELQGALAIQREAWPEAASAYHRAAIYAGADYPNINYAFIADIAAKANRPLLAAWYRLRAWQPGQPPAPSPSPSPGASLPSPLAAADPQAKGFLEELGNIGQDIERHNEEGIAHADQGQFAAARAAFLAALKLDPGYPPTLNNLGALTQQEGNLDEAIALYRRALEREPNYADAHYNLATAFLRQGKYTEASEHIDKAQQQGKDVTALRQAVEKNQP